MDPRELFSKILLWTQMGSRRAVDVLANNGRTYQVAGTLPGAGPWERLFPPKDHPYRRNASREEVEAVLTTAVKFTIYEGATTAPKEAVSESELLTLIT